MNISVDMHYNPVGTSDLLVSEIGFGCMSLGTDDAANARLLNLALDHGVNYFDTADIYQKGDNEITLGKAFTKCFPGFVECVRHSAKQLLPVVGTIYICTCKHLQRES